VPLPAPGNPSRIMRIMKVSLVGNDACSAARLPVFA